MAKIWVDIPVTITPDGKEAMSALTKPVVSKIKDSLVDATAKALPGNFSNNAGDKPKDKRNDHAARAVRFDETLAIKVAAQGSKIVIDGEFTLILSTLNLKSATEKGELVGQYGTKVKELAKRGTLEKDFEALATALLKELNIGAVVSKAINGTAFKSAAAQRNMALD